MKKTLLTCLICGFAATVFAQPAKGTKFLGGSLNFAGAEGDGGEFSLSNHSNAFTFQVNPQFGYFVSEHFAIGVMAQFGATSNQTNHYSGTILINNTTSKGMLYGGGVFARYYKNIAGNLFFMLHAVGNYSLTNTKTTNFDFFSGTNTIKSDRQNASLSVSPGLVYFVTPKLGIETQFGSLYGTYFSSKTKNTPSSDSNGLEYGLNLNSSSFYLGLHFYF